MTEEEKKIYNRAINDVMKTFDIAVPVKKKSTFLVLQKIQSLRKPIGSADSTEIDRCAHFWAECLRHHKKERLILNRDLVAIKQALRRDGLAAVELALIGARYEEGNRDFNPSKYVRLSRVFNPEKMEYFINIGAGQVQKEKKAHARREIEKALEDSQGDEVNPMALKLVKGVTG